MRPIPERSLSRRVPRKSTFQDCLAYAPGLTECRVKPEPTNITKSPAGEPSRKFDVEKHGKANTSRMMTHTNRTLRSTNVRDRRRLYNKSHSAREPKIENKSLLPKPITDCDYWQPKVVLKRLHNKMDQIPATSEKVSPSNRLVNTEIRNNQYAGVVIVGSDRQQRSNRGGVVLRHQMSGGIEGPSEFKAIRERVVRETDKKNTIDPQAKHLETIETRQLVPHPSVPFLLNYDASPFVKSSEANIGKKLQGSQSRIHADTSSKKEVEATADRHVGATSDSVDWSSIHVMKLVDKIQDTKEATANLLCEIMALKRLATVRQQENELLKQKLERYKSNELYQALNQAVEEADKKGTGMAHSLVKQVHSYGRLKRGGET